jgi:hypothetical protein
VAIKQASRLASVAAKSKYIVVLQIASPPIVVHMILVQQNHYHSDRLDTLGSVKQMPKLVNAIP